MADSTDSDAGPGGGQPRRFDPLPIAAAVFFTRPLTTLAQ